MRSKLLQRKYQEDRKNDKAFCDFLIRCEEKQFHVHRCVLRIFSDFFKTMFASNMKEKYENETNISVVSAETMTIIIEFLYDDDVKVNRENVYNLLSAADFLQISALKEACRDYLENNFISETVLKDWMWLERYHMHSQAIERNVLKNRVHIMKQQSVSELDQNDFQDLLILLKNHVPPSVTYRYIMNWLEQDSRVRLNYLDRLMEHIDFKSLERKFLTDTVSKNEAIRNFPTTMSKVLDAVCTLVHEEPKFSVDVKMAGIWEVKDKCHLRMFSTKSKDWTKLASIDPKHKESGSIIFNDKLYMLGGKGTQFYCSNKAWYQDLNDVSSGWNSMKPMNSARRRFACAMYKNFMFVTGGLLRNHYWKNDVECYKFDCERWLEKNKMIYRRASHALVSHGGLLYALGGESNSSPAVKSVEYFNGRIWKETAPMKKPRNDFSAVVLNDQIYAIGGDQDDLTSVELYDPRANAWCDVASMTKQRSGHVYACVANGKIYAMNDKDQSAEVYDPVVEEWCELVRNTSI
ncbi:unnamed protein product [Clavelina lepadiformis]|uniref:BTB domain-containing protein n=1 Tax=Clavelina lepadiformis TaxID=159417 RepID=A0ABP0GS75_CLALP